MRSSTKEGKREQRKVEEGDGLRAKYRKMRNNKRRDNEEEEEGCVDEVEEMRREREGSKH